MVMIRVCVKPEILRWARERAGLEIEDLIHRFPQYHRWENGYVQPTLKQLEAFAKLTRVAVGHFFLSDLLDESLPIPDFRAMRRVSPGYPSPDMLDIIHLCQCRQEWYRGHARAGGRESLPFVGSASLNDDIEAVAGEIRATLGFDLESSGSQDSDWTEASRHLVELIGKARVLVMISGVAVSDVRRTLDPNEFRGFALADDLAPLIFVNGADTKEARMFTLVHELAHLWLGQSALSDSRLDVLPGHNIEAWCNRVAVEFLVPVTQICEEYRREDNLPDALANLAWDFNVNTLVMLRGIYDVGGLTREEFRHAYDAELENLKACQRPSGGGSPRASDAYIDDRFVRAVVASTLEDETLFAESCQLLGLRKVREFSELVDRLGLG